jgi:hypothetical protein
MWIAARIQIVSANFDPEVLQWPGGSLIAIFLWLYATVHHLLVRRMNAATLSCNDLSASSFAYTM